ncbi:MAG: FtsH protease activity modulator HflK [Candidatus Omnitrophica bacterium]|nr:FtsH protease activity modulator HflK [Candidatus Omnitrophota bacterium]
MEINIPRGGSGGLPQFKFNKWVVPLIIVVVVFSSVGSVFYTVAPDEVGVVKRLGQYVRTTNPGLRVRLPWGIETVRKVRVQHYFKEEFGFRTKQAGVKTEYYSPEEYGTRRQFYSLGEYVKKTGLSSQDVFLAESLMLTGDLNAAQVEWIIQYRIQDPIAYAFNIRDMQGTVRNMAEAVMRQVVGDATVDEVITYGKDIIEQQSQEKLQSILDELRTGIKVTSVVLQDVNPPLQVKDSFNEVNEARQDKERFINQAWQEYNRAIPQAKGEAEKRIREAEGYAMQRINSAQGDAERFLATWEEYQKAKDVTRRRMYLEAMREVLPKFQRKIIIDENQTGILPLLNLNEQEGN